jgi:hypothetical protein
MLSFVIGLLAGASLGCIAGFMLCSWLTAGRIQDAERAAALEEYRAKMRQRDETGIDLDRFGNRID